MSALFYYLGMFGMVPSCPAGPSTDDKADP